MSKALEELSGTGRIWRDWIGDISDWDPSSIWLISRGVWHLNDCLYFQPVADEGSETRSVDYSRVCFRFPASAVLIFISIFICKHISSCFRVSLQLAYPNGNPCRQHSLLNLILILGPEFPVGDQACCCTCAASYQGLSGTVFTFSRDSRWQGSPVFIIVVAPRQLMEQPIPLKVSRWTAGSKKHYPKLAFWTHYRTQNKNSYGNKLKA